MGADQNGKRNGRGIVRTARRAIARLTRLPKPSYAATTPGVFGTDPFDAFLPPNAGTLAEAALSPDSARFVATVLGRLTPSEELRRQLFYYQWGAAKFGEFWRFADITTVLRAAALLVKPEAYLEIGVRRGRSASIIGATCPHCAIYGFDLWLGGYAGDDNPGPDFVRGELRAAGHLGPVELVSGDSRATVPAFLRSHPELYFDVITVDGDHTVAGAARDLANVLPRLKVGGVLVFDDIRIAPMLRRVWDRLVRSDTRFVTWEYTDGGYGVAAAVRLSDRPTLGMAR